MIDHNKGNIYDIYEQDITEIDMSTHLPRWKALLEAGDESVSRYARANKNKCKCAGVFDHQELSTNITISVVRALGLSVRSVRRGTSRHVLGKHEDATHHDHETLE